jgi:hypothetical protein
MQMHTDAALPVLSDLGIANLPDVYVNDNRHTAAESSALTRTLAFPNQ